MESAGEAFVRHVGEVSSVLVLVGPGLNGVDGWVIARLLSQRGVPVSVWCVAGSSDLWRQKEMQASKAKRLSTAELLAGSSHFDLVVDALFGTGTLRAPEGEIQKVLHHVQQWRVPKFAVDLPSGMNADTGEVWDCTLRCELSVTFAAAKPCFFVAQARRWIGKMRVESLIFPQDLLREFARTHFAVGTRYFSKAAPTRSAHLNKSHFGKVLVLCGSQKFPGAGVLVGRGALRAGVGFTKLVSEYPYSEISDLPEALYTEKDQLQIFPEHKDWVVVAGSGWDGLNSQRRIWLRELLRIPRVVLDAGALEFVKESRMPSTWILTPHSGELARILNIGTEQVEADRWGWVRRAEEEFGCVVVLKGNRTLVSERGRTAAVLTGNAGLAKAGSGDVLAGMIAGFWAQLSDDAKPSRAALLGAIFHGWLAERWSEQWPLRALTPSDLVNRSESKCAEG